MSLHVRSAEHMQSTIACGLKVPDKEVGDRCDTRRHILRPSPKRLCSVLQQEGVKARVWKMRHFYCEKCQG